MVLDIQKEIDKHWTRSSAGYSRIIRDELDSFRVPAWLNLIASQTAAGKKLNVLDVGTGPGFFAIILARNGHRVTGIDSSKGMIEQARVNAEAANVIHDLRVMDSHHLEFADNCFDVVLSRNVTWTQRNPIAAYTEWKRVLKPGGRLLIFDANWKLPDYDETLAEMVKDRERLFRGKYGSPYDTYDGPEDERELPTELPLANQHRPSWDNGALSALGFINILNDPDITDRVWDEKEQLLYGATPMFMVAATKCS